MIEPPAEYNPKLLLRYASLWHYMFVDPSAVLVRFVIRCFWLISLTCMISSCALHRGDAGPLEIRVSHTSILDFDDLPSLRAEQLLAAKGYRLSRTLLC